MSAPATTLDIHLFPCLEDNYGYLVHDPVSGDTAAIDCPASAPVAAALRQRGWRLDYILCTHHHGDHTGGNPDLKSLTGCRIAGGRQDAARIPALDIALDDGDHIALGRHRITVREVPGHTRGHVMYLFEADGAAFLGDTLFAMGCGRLFEGTPAEMWASLQKILALPDTTRLYCGHEYTLKNAHFALTVDPANEALRQRASEVERLRSQGIPTMPTILALERLTNPFLRPDDPAIRATLGLQAADTVEVFAEIRRQRNAF